MHILHLEDAEADASLVEHALRAGGIDCVLRRVDSAAAFVHALQQQAPDVILADFNLPGVDGRAALRQARDLLPRTPVIVVTGAMPDEAAVELLREGASDYILKDRLSRLVPALQRAVAAAAESRRLDELAQALRDSELRYRRLFETAQDGILIIDADSRTIVDANPYLLDLVGCTSDEVLGGRGSQFGDLGGSGDDAAGRTFAPLQAAAGVRFEHLSLRTPSGRTVDVEVIGNAYEAGGCRYLQFIIRDIRERIAAQRALAERLHELRQFQRVTVDRELRLQELEAEVARLRRTGA